MDIKDLEKAVHDVISEDDLPKNIGNGLYRLPPGNIIVSEPLMNLMEEMHEWVHEENRVLNIIDKYFNNNKDEVSNSRKL